MSVCVYALCVCVLLLRRRLLIFLKEFLCIFLVEGSQCSAVAVLREVFFVDESMSACLCLCLCWSDSESVDMNKTFSANQKYSASVTSVQPY